MAVYCKMMDEHTGRPRDVLLAGGSQGMDIGLQLSGTAVGKHVRSEQTINISAASELSRHKSHVSVVAAEHGPSHMTMGQNPENPLVLELQPSRADHVDTPDCRTTLISPE